MPDPERKETGPEGQDDTKDEKQDFGFGGTWRTRSAAPVGPSRPGLRHPVKPAQRSVQCSNSQSRTENAGAEEHAQISLGALLVPFWNAQLAFLVLPILQVKCDHHGQTKSYSQPPGQADTQQARGVRGGGVQGMGHSPVAVHAHGGEGEDGGVHGEEVEAQKKAAAQLTEGPARCQTVIHNEGGSEQVEQISKSKAQHLEVKRR